MKASKLDLSTIVVEKGIPIPPKPQKMAAGLIAVFQKLSPGDSVFLPSVDEATARKTETYAKTITKKHKLAIDTRILTRETESGAKSCGVRIWRMEQ